MRARRFSTRKISVRIALAVSLLIGMQACGGGTGGTGVKVYQGNVRTLDQKPLRDARLTIEDTGETSSTDAEGNFSLFSKAFGARVNFLFETPQFSTSFTLTNISEDSSRINIGLVVDPALRKVEITQFSVKANIIGDCMRYFSNQESIEQIDEIPSSGSVLCTLDIRVYGDGLLRRKIPVVLQHSNCDSGSPWVTDEQTETGDGKHRGIARINFQFSPSKESCRYRILAPFNYRGFTPLSYPINTLIENR
jgi:hypothetical protein